MKKDPFGFSFEEFANLFPGHKHPLTKKYPNFEKYPPLIKECLLINERMQAIGS